MIMCFLFAIPGSYHILLGTPHILPFSLDSNESFALGVSFETYNASTSFNSVVQGCVTGFTTLVLNLICLIILKKKVNSKLKKISQAQITLFIITLWDFIFEIIWVTHQTWIHIFVIHEDVYNPVFDTLYLAVPWLYDFGVLTRPYIIFILCKQVRTTLIKSSKNSLFFMKNSIVDSARIHVILRRNKVVS